MKRRMTWAIACCVMMLALGVAEGAPIKIRNGSFEEPLLFPAISANDKPSRWSQSVGANLSMWDLNISAAPVAFPCPGTLCAADGRQVLILQNSGDPAEPSAVSTKVGEAGPNEEYTFSFAQGQQANISGTGAGVTLELWNFNPLTTLGVLVDSISFPAAPEGRWIVREATLRTSATFVPSTGLHIRLVHAPGVLGSGTGNAIVDDVRVFDLDEDGLEGDEDLCPTDPIPYQWPASPLPASAGFPRIGNFDGPNPGVNLDGDTPGYSANWLQFGRGVIPTLAEGGPNYETCGGERFEHSQDLSVIGDRLDGRAHYAMTHSQDNFGHFMVFRSFPSRVGTGQNQHEIQSLGNPNLNTTTSMNAAIRDGDGIFYRKYDDTAPEGPYNHPGDLARLGDMLLVAAQNWDGGVCQLNRYDVPNRLITGSGSLANVPEPDAVLFYDASDPYHPEYRGKILIAELPLDSTGVPFLIGEFATLGVQEKDGFVYMFISDGSTSRWFRSDELSWRADDWTPVDAAVVASEIPVGNTDIKIAMEIAPLGVQSASFTRQSGADAVYVIGNPLAAADTQREHGFGPSVYYNEVNNLNDLWVAPSGRSELVVANGLGFASPTSDGFYVIESHTIHYADDNDVKWPQTNGPPTTVNPGAPEFACEPPAFVELDLAVDGDGRVTRDVQTGLEWLDLTETAGLSINDVLAGAGGWVADGWILATEEQVCVLIEHASGNDGTSCATDALQASFPGNVRPSIFDRTVSMLGATKTQFGSEVTLSTPSPPSFGAPERLNAANSACGPDGQTGLCAAQGVYVSSTGVNVSSLNRGLDKCDAVDTRTCMDGIAAGLPLGTPSTCLKCALHGDAAFGGLDQETAMADTGVYLVRGATEVQLQFQGDGETLGWTDQVNADTFNVYRGTLSSLSDGNGDGLPDGGYGSCFSTIDPDTEATEIADPEVPAPGNGFFYLVASDGLAETGLGSTSEGLARVPTVSCP